MSTFKIIAVTNRNLSAGDYFGRIEIIAKSGVDAIIVREKDLPEIEYEILARKVMKICEKNGTECILHTFTKTAQKLGCGAIHLPMHLLRDAARGGLSAPEDAGHHARGGLSAPEDARHHARGGLSAFEKVGASVHSVEEAEEAQRLGANYITAGHVFETDCKKGLQPRGIVFLRDVVEAVSVPVYAIGGINRANIEQTRAAGAAGACVMSQMMNGKF